MRKKAAAYLIVCIASLCVIVQVALNLGRMQLAEADLLAMTPDILLGLVAFILTTTCIFRAAILTERIEEETGTVEIPVLAEVGIPEDCDVEDTPHCWRNCHKTCVVKQTML